MLRDEAHFGVDPAAGRLPSEQRHFLAFVELLRARTAAEYRSKSIQGQRSETQLGEFAAPSGTDRHDPTLQVQDLRNEHT
jgi:hypothetical protein